MELILVTDFGTSNVRVQAICVATGGIYASSARRYNIESPQTGYCELDMEYIWHCSEDCMEQIIEELEQDCHVAAITFSFFGACTVPADEKGEAVDKGILCFDCRGGEEADEINRIMGVKRYTGITGGECDPSSMGARIRWLRQHKPEIYSRAVYFWTNQQYILSKLGFFGCSEYTMASKTELLDDESAEWSEEILKAVGISEASLGCVVHPETVLGEITRYGKVVLPYPVRVLPGLHDAIAGFLGLGISGEEPDVLAEVTGTFDHIGMITDYYLNCHNEYPEYDIWSSRGPCGTSSACIAYYPTSGALLEWFLREMAEGASLEELWDGCTLDGTGTVRVCPAYYNSEGRIEGLTIQTSRGEIFQAIVEALTYETRRCIEICEAVRGTEIKRVRIGGGEAKSDAWTQLRADITGKIYERSEVIESSSLGAAVLAAVSLGFYKGYADAIEEMVHIEKAFYPRKQIGDVYEELYAESRKNK